MILHGECGQFNPILLECFIAIEAELKEDLEKKNGSWVS